MKVSRNELKRELLFLCEALNSIQREWLHITQVKKMKGVELEFFNRKIDNLARHLVSFKRFVEMLEDEKSK